MGVCVCVCVVVVVVAFLFFFSVKKEDKNQCDFFQCHKFIVVLTQDLHVFGDSISKFVVTLFE